jgi:hypothetical protein
LAYWTTAYDGTSPTILNQGTLRFSVASTNGNSWGISPALTNTGTLDISAGAVYLGDLTNYSNQTLTGGTYLVKGALIIPDADIQTNAATVVLDGAAAQIGKDVQYNGVIPYYDDALAHLTANAAGGSFTIQNGRNFSVPAGFTNAGNLTIGAGSTLLLGALDQYASTVLDFSSERSDDYGSAAQALGPPDTFIYGTGYWTLAWMPYYKPAAHEYLTLGFTTPVYATGATIRETSGNGFVYQVDALDTNDVLHTVWTGTDPSQPGSPVDFLIAWAPTPYLVKGLKIYVDTTLNHNPYSSDAIDSVQLHDASGMSYTQQAGGSLALQGGTLSATGLVALQGGSLLGQGTVNANVQSAGHVRPGTASTPGTLTVNGSYTQTAAGSLDVKIGGTGTGLFDQPQVTGAATLDGGLNVSTINGFLPGTGDSFAVLTGASRSGQFATATGLDIDSQHSFRVVYDPSDVKLLGVGAPIVVTPTSGLVTTEAGGTARFTVVLTSQPRANVAIGLSSSDPSAGTVSPASLTFTPGNWNVPQTVTVTGQADGVLTGDTPYTIVTSPAVSADPLYSGFDPSDVLVTNQETATRDLQVTGLSVSPATLAAGGPLTVTWQDTDSGSLAVASSFTDLVTIRNRTTGQTLTTASVPYDVTARGPIGPGGSAGQQFTFTLPPAGAGAGQIQVTVTTNANHDIVESDAAGTAGTNNTASLTVTSALAAPDLQVVNLQLTPATGLQSGDNVLVTWDDANTGTVATGSPFSDLVTVTNLTTRATLATGVVQYDPSVAGNGPIAAGDARARQYAFTLPDGNPAVGQVQVTVTSDVYNQIAEFNASSTAETNNTASVTTTAALAPYPDLAVANVSAPPLTIADPAQVTVGWTVTNVGTGPGQAPSWVDEVLVSTNADANNPYAPVLARFPHKGALAPGSSYQQQQTFLLPAGFHGRYHLFVRTDADHQVFQNGSTANDVAEAGNFFDVTTEPYADLIVTALNVPQTANSGQPIHVTWTVANQGIATTTVNAEMDTFVLTSDPQGQQTVAVLGSVAHIGALAPGQSYDQTADLALPNGLSGPYYVQVRTSGGDEFIYTDNNGRVAGPVQVTLSPSADLAVTSVSAPSTATAGDQIEVSWTVANQGVATAVGGPTAIFSHQGWVDSVVLQDTSNGKNYGLGAFDYQGPLDPGKSYTRTQLVRLPTDLPGLFRIVVTTNVTGVVLADPGPDPRRPAYEGSATANDVLASDPLELAEPAHPDLQVQNVSLSRSEVTGGGTIDVQFDIINRGTVPTSTPHWKDRIWLNDTPTVGSGAAQLDEEANGSALGPDESYRTVAKDVIIPKRLSGPGYIIVQSNADQSVDEFPKTTSSIVAVPITVDALPPADLVISNVQAPTQAFDGTSIQVSYTVTNLGTGPTDKDTWTDAIFLTTRNRRPDPEHTVAVVASVTHTGVLNVGDHYDVTVTVPIKVPGPDFGLGTGQYYLFPWTNSYQQVHEVTLDQNIDPSLPPDQRAELDNNNYKGVPLTIITQPASDLEVTRVDPQPQGVGAQPFTVRWTVTNEGAVTTEGSSWSDRVCLSDAPTLHAGAHEYILGDVPHQGALGPGQSYTAEFDPLLSPAASGRYIIIETPVNGNLGYPHGSRQGFGRTYVVPTPAAALQVAQIVTQPQNFSGEKTTVQWTVTNFGATVWPGTRYWQDAVYLSPDPTFIWTRATSLGSFVHSNAQPLAAGASYTQTQTVTLPRGIGGNYCIYVVTDTSFGSDPLKGAQALGQGDYSDPSVPLYYRKHAWAGGGANERNNMGMAPIPVTYREPDLVVSKVVLPSGPIHAGDIIPVTFTVTNQGRRDTRTPIWYDGVYLSRTTSLTPDGKQLAKVWHDDFLAAGSSYTATTTVQIPYGISGNFYLLVYTDTTIEELPPPLGNGLVNLAREPRQLVLIGGMGAVEEFRDEGNNLSAPQLLPVLASTLPDLQVTSVQAPQHVTAGQSFDLTYTVTNTGTADAPEPSTLGRGRYDYVLLSHDPVVDVESDRVLTDPHLQLGGLAAGHSYTVTLHAHAPSDLIGSFYVFVATDPPRASAPRGELTFEQDKLNNIGRTPQPVIFDAPPAGVLRVDDVEIKPTAAMPGDTVQVTYTVSNQGDVPIAGGWTDALYLSTSPNWDLSALLLDRVDAGQPLNPGQSYTVTHQVRIPTATPGPYHVLVRSDLFDQVTLAADRSRRVGASTEVLNLTVPALQLGVPLSTTLSKGEDKVFQVTVGQGQTLRVDLSSDAPDAANELFVRLAALPSDTAYDAAYQGGLAPNQTAVVPTTQPGTYHVMIRGQSEPGDDTPTTLLAWLEPFGITDVTPDHGGDSGYVTTTILGAQFDPQAVVKLVRPGFAELEPVSYQVVDATKIVAVFDFRGAPHGLYDVVVKNPDGRQTILPYRYLVEQGLEPDIAIGLGGPRDLRSLNAALYTFTIQSQTNVDVPYVQFQVGGPNFPVTNPALGPRVSYLTNLRGPDSGPGKDLPWASLTSELNTDGEVLAPGYVLELPDQGSAGFTLTAQPWPVLKQLHDEDPVAFNKLRGGGGDDAATWFHILATATPMTRDEFVAQRKAEALKLRGAILADPTAAQPLVLLAADANNWVQLYLAALEEAGLLLPDGAAPQARTSPEVVSLTSTLASGLLLGPAGNQIISNGSLVDFFAQVRKWYGNDDSLVSPFLDPPGNYDKAPAPATNPYDLGLTDPTHFEAFNTWIDRASFFPTGRFILPPAPPAFTSLFSVKGAIGQLATLSGPDGYGDGNFVPVGQPLPYTINFANAASAPAAVGEVRIVSQLDPSLNPLSFRLGDIQLGDIQVHIPAGRATFQGDFDFTRSKGFVLRVVAGLDMQSDTATWLLQAIDPATGEVITDPAKGLLPPNDAQDHGAGLVSFTVEPKDHTPSGTQVTTQARVAFNTTAPYDTNPVTVTVDGAAPATTLTATPVTPGGSDYQVQWTAQDEPGGSGVAHVTVYVAEDGGPYQIWLRQTTDTSGICNGQPGHTYQFLALATDNAGNQEQAPLSLTVPNDGSQVNLGAPPTFSTTHDTGPATPPPAPLPQPSTNPLFLEAQKGIPGAPPATQPSEFPSALRPFVGGAFATGIGQSEGNIGPVALVVLSDGSVLASGGPGRNQLFHLGRAGGAVSTPLATLSDPIYDMALDSAGNLWATTGGGALLQLDPQNGVVLGRYGDSVTQSLAVDPASGLIYVTAGHGLDVFDPQAKTFRHYSNVRAGSLAFGPDGQLWAALWRGHANQVVRFDLTNPQAANQPQLMLQLDAPIDSIAFSLQGSPLDGLLFLTHDRPALAGEGTGLTMVDTATMQQVTVATGGTRGDEIKTTADGRVLLSQTHQIDVLNPILAPRVIGTNPPPDATVALPLGSVSVTFDHDMFLGDASDARSVLDLANYQLTREDGTAVTIQSAAYDQTSRTAVLTFDAIDAGDYQLQVSTNVQSTDGLGLAEMYTTHFTAVTDISALVALQFSHSRLDRLDQTVSYDVTVTNTGTHALVLPVVLQLSPLAHFAGEPVGAQGRAADGSWLIDLSAALPDGLLRPGSRSPAAPSRCRTPGPSGSPSCPASSATPRRPPSRSSPPRQ